MSGKLHKDNKGFTIIEVLIVLAIAGLIMLIVFLAVPALQRNQRNNARNSEASRISAAITECLANRNGQVPSCDDQADISPSFVDMTTLGQLTGWGAKNETSVLVTFNSECSADGTTAVGGGSARSFSVEFQLEPTIDRCIAS